MAKKCKQCGENITIDAVKDQAQNDPIRTKAIKKDFYICLAFGFCISCIRAKQQEKNYLEEANKYKDIMKKAFKNEKQLKAELRKRGLTEEQINSELPKFKNLIK